MAPAGDQGAAGGEQVAAGGVIMHAGIAARFSLPHPASAGAMWPLQVKRGDAESGGRPGGMLLCRGKAAPPFPALALPCPCSQKKPHRVLLVIRHHYNPPPPSSLPPSLPPLLLPPPPPSRSSPYFPSGWSLRRSRTDSFTCHRHYREVGQGGGTETGEWRQEERRKAFNLT